MCNNHQNLAGFSVIQSGFNALFQDLGRYAHLAQGLSHAHPMDLKAFLWGNKLLGNPFDASAIEIPYGHFQIKANANTYGITTGADLTFVLNGKKQPRYTVFKIKPNDILHWQHPREGIRAYFSVLGGFQERIRFGSKSTNLRENIGSPIQKKQTLFIRKVEITSPTTQLHFMTLPNQFFPHYPSEITLRFIPSFQWNTFSPDQQESFLTQSFLLTRDHNRTGARLKANKPIKTNTTNMISEGMTSGSIQIPPNGHPIVMVSEAPTMGGYPKIGNVVQLDLGKLNQCHPNSKVHFKAVNIEQVQRERRKIDQFFEIQT